MSITFNADGKCTGKATAVFDGESAPNVKSLVDALNGSSVHDKTIKASQSGLTITRPSAQKKAQEKEGVKASKISIIRPSQDPSFLYKKEIFFLKQHYPKDLTISK